MKKRTLLSSLVCIMVACSILLVTLTSAVTAGAAAASLNLAGVREGLQRISNAFAERFSEPRETAPAPVRPTELYYVGGMPVGLKLYAEGVVVVDAESVETADGPVSPAEKAGIRVGDILLSVNGQRTTRNADVADLIEQSGGNVLHLRVRRGDVVFETEFSSAYCTAERKYKAGLWVRDSSAGIGTVSFMTADGAFASLGHAVCDIDTGEVIPLLTGETADVTLTGFVRGENGAAGELCGTLGGARTGTVYSNGRLGVYGVFDALDTTRLQLPIASPDEVAVGDAELYTSVRNGDVRSYTVKITSVNPRATEHKQLVVRVTDPTLISLTGGIVQGMSGSPLVQNGKIIGAVTHVFLDDPTGGYGIFAAEMLAQLDSVGIPGAA